MRDRDKTREQLLLELSEHRRWLGEMDIPEARLKLAVQALEESGDDSLSFARDLPDAFFLFTREHRIVSCNKACLDLLGYTEGELESSSIRQIQESDENFDAFQQISDFAAQSQPFHKTDGRFLRKDGTAFPAETLVAPIAGESDAIRTILCLVRDISSSIKTENVLRESEAKHRDILDSIEEGYFEVDLSGTLIFINDSLCKITRREREELLGMNYREYTVTENAKKLYSFFNEIYQTGKPAKLIDHEIITYKGERRILQMSASLMRDRDGNPCGFRGIVRDVTNRKRAEEALKESELKFRSIFDLCPEAIALSDVQTGRLIDVNEKFCERTKYTRDEVIGRTTVETGLYSDENRQRFINELRATGEVHGLEMDFNAKDGSMLNVLMFSRIIQVGGRSFIFNIFLDMTERNRLEAQLQHAQKMKAVTTLAGGIAHEFNNALAALGGNLELLEIGLPSDPFMQNRTKAMKSSIRRMVNLTNQLTAYAQGGEHQAKAISLNRTVESVLKKMRSNISPAIEIEKRFGRQVPSVQADSIQMQMVVSAILNNAMEALNGGGRICISTGGVEIDEATAVDHAGLKPGRYGCLIIEDNGVGMSEDTKTRIFDPFFSTKFQGRGLGMAAVYGIIKNHNGWLTVDSQQGAGSTVSMYLPAAEPQK